MPSQQRTSAIRVDPRLAFPYLLNMISIKTLGGLLLGIFLLGGGSGAATIEAVGVDAANVESWRSTDVPKPFATGEVAAYGVDGYVIFFAEDALLDGPYQFSPGNPFAKVRVLESMPSWLFVSNVEMNTSGVSSSFENIDDPTQPIAATVSDVKPGLGGRGGERNAELFEFSLLGDVPGSGFRLGIIAPNSGNDAPSSIVVTQVSGGDASAKHNGPVPGPSAYAVYFFDLRGLSYGDAFRVAATKPHGGNSNVMVNGFTLDVLP